MHSAPATITFDTAPREVEALAHALAGEGWALDLATCTDFSEGGTVEVRLGCDTVVAPPK